MKKSLIYLSIALVLLSGCSMKFNKDKREVYHKGDFKPEKLTEKQFADLLELVDSTQEIIHGRDYIPPEDPEEIFDEDDSLPPLDKETIAALPEKQEFYPKQQEGFEGYMVPDDYMDVYYEYSVPERGGTYIVIPENYDILTYDKIEHVRAGQFFYFEKILSLDDFNDVKVGDDMEKVRKIDSTLDVQMKYTVTTAPKAPNFEISTYDVKESKKKSMHMCMDGYVVFTYDENGKIEKRKSGKSILCDLIRQRYNAGKKKKDWK